MVLVRHGMGILLGTLTMVALAGCGSAAATGLASAPGPSVASPSPSTTSMPTAMGASGPPTVYSIQANRTAQMVLAGKPATFVVTARSQTGQPVANQPVTFYIGPMVPLSNVPPKRWLVSGTAAAQPYIASYSKKTHQNGQATLVLRAQPTQSMEMVGVRIGNLSSYSASKGKALGSLDAWWTTAQTAPTAPVGDFVTINPFVTMASAYASVPVTVRVNSPAGPIVGASVLITPQVGGSGGMGSSSMGSSMSSTGGTSVMTNTSGQATYKAMSGASGSMLPIRIVVTQDSQMMRVAGGMNAEVIAK